MADEVKFFTARREIQFGDFHSLKTRGGERRVKVPVSVPLSNIPTTGVPDWVLDGFQFVVKDDAPYNKTMCGKNRKMEGMSIVFYSSDTVKRKMQGVSGLNGCTMDRFAVEKVGEGEKAIVYLTFIVYAPCSKDIIGWFYDHQGASIFAEFDTTQATLAYEGEEEDEETEASGDLPFSGDPNDDPDAPIPGDDREVTPASSKPTIVKRSHHKKK